MILEGLSMAPRTGLSAGEVGRRLLGCTGRRPDRSALTSLHQLRRRGLVRRAMFSDARRWYITDDGLRAVAGEQRQAA